MENTNEDREARLSQTDGVVMARLDMERLQRCGSPEAVFALKKTPDETLAIAESLAERQGYVLVTRADRETIRRLRERWPDLRLAAHSGAALIGSPPKKQRSDAWIAIVCAGTSDLPVAEEVGLTLESLGLEGRIIADVGVAGLHRLLGQLEWLRQATVVVAVAGMEGALPSVVAGLVSAPVIAVPTSVGYGASLGGLAALLGMLNTCSPGVSVVNIDNGFGAAVTAARIMNAGDAAERPAQA